MSIENNSICKMYISVNEEGEAFLHIVPNSNVFHGERFGPLTIEQIQAYKILIKAQQLASLD